MNKPILSLVIPCYNEQEMLPISGPILVQKLDTLINTDRVHSASYVLLVDDGSTDNTWGVMETLCSTYSNMKAIRLSHNRGHQTALWAGMEHAASSADAIISLDCDLQDDIDAIDLMVEKFVGGADIVCGVRSDRKTDTFLKRFTAHAFYKFMEFCGAPTIYDHADYRLLSKRALMSCLQYKETNLFLRGLIPNLGYNIDYVYFSRKEREAGKSKYGLWKMLSLAIDGITSFSIKPLFWIMILGGLSYLVGLGIGVAMIVLAIIGHTVSISYWILLSIWLLAGFLLIALGIVGIYVGKTYIESKNRPRYFIMDELK